MNTGNNDSRLLRHILAILLLPTGLILSGTGSIASPYDTINIEGWQGISNPVADWQAVIKDLKPRPESERKRVKPTVTLTTDPYVTGKSIIQNFQLKKAARRSKPDNSRGLSSLKKLQHIVHKGKKSSSVLVRQNRNTGTPTFIRPAGKGIPSRNTVRLSATPSRSVSSRIKIRLFPSRENPFWRVS